MYFADEDGLITQAILLGNIEAAVSLCFDNKRYADAVILSMAAGPDLLARTQYRYFSEHSGALNSLINSLVSENWAEVVKNTDINCWKEVLIGIFTHSTPQERSTLCGMNEIMNFLEAQKHMMYNFQPVSYAADMLGDRLASCDDPTLKEEAQICYICSGNLNKMIESSNVDIQEVVELVMIMQKALEMQGIRDIQIEGKIANVLSHYAEMLASEGDLDAALNYLGNSQDEKIIMLKDRLCRALGYIQEPKSMARAPAMQQNYYDQTRRPVQTVQNPLLVAREQARPFADTNVPPARQSFVPSTNPFNAQQQPQPFGLSPLQPQMQSMQYDQYQTSHSYTSAPVSQPPPPPPPTTGSSGIGSRPPSVGPQARSKYLIDPSVKSTATYGQTGFPQQASPYSNQIPPLPGYSTLNTYQPQVPVATNAYPGHSFSTTPKDPEPFKPVQPSILSPLQSQQESQMYEPIRSQPHPQTQVYGNESIYQAPLQPAGWNDPPIAKPSRAQVTILICFIY